MSTSSSYLSTSSLRSGTSQASRQSSPMSSSKDFSAAFGELQSSYGLGGGRSTPSIPNTRGHSKSRSLFRSSTSSSPSSSAPSSRPSTAFSTNSPRNFEASLASLSGSYGFVGAAPSLPPTSQKTPSRRCETLAISKKMLRDDKSKHLSEREAAFGQLSSLHGFAERGAAPAFR